MLIAKAEPRTQSRALAGWSSKATYAPVALLGVCLLGITLIQLAWGFAFLRWPFEVLGPSTTA